MQWQTKYMHLHLRFFVHNFLFFSSLYLFVFHLANFLEFTIKLDNWREKHITNILYRFDIAQLENKYTYNRNEYIYIFVCINIERWLDRSMKSSCAVCMCVCLPFGPIVRVYVQKITLSLACMKWKTKKKKILQIQKFPRKFQSEHKNKWTHETMTTTTHFRWTIFVYSFRPGLDSMAMAAAMQRPKRMPCVKRKNT